MSDNTNVLQQLQSLFNEKLTPIKKAKLEDILHRKAGPGAPIYENQTNPADKEILNQAIYQLLMELKHFKMARPQDYEKMRTHVTFIMNQVNQLKQQGNLDMARILLAGLLSQLKSGTIAIRDIYNPTEI